MVVIICSAAVFSAVFYVCSWMFRHGPAVPGRPSILLYHKIEPRLEWGVTWNTPGQFSRHLRALHRRGCTVRPLQEVVESISRGILPEGGVLALTFDDGYVGLYHHALPVLNELNWPATVFVVTGYVGRENRWDVNVGWRRFRHLDWQMMQEMAARGISFGSHTVTHPDLTRLSSARVLYELEHSKAELEDRLGTSVDYISYPFGRYDPRVQELTRRAGYRAAFATYPRGRNAQDEAFALRRTGVYFIDTVRDVQDKANSRAHPLVFAYHDLRGRAIHFLAQGTPLAKAIFPKKP